MFSLFGKRKNYSVGIDFGTSAIKIVELSYKNQKLYLENYGWVSFGSSHLFLPEMPKISESPVSYDKKLQKYLEKLIRTMRLKSDSAYISLPGFSGLISIIEFPEMDAKELEEAIKFEAQKHIPTSLDEVAIDWEIIGKNEEEPESNKDESGENKPSLKKDLEGAVKKDTKIGKKNEILLVAASKNEVIKCGNLVRESGLGVKNVELELFSLVRSIVGSDPGCFLIIDIGARITNVILVENGVIKVNRNIEGGGNEITNVIADSLNISKQRAEELKRKNKDLLNNREMSLVIPVLEMISNEAKRIMNAYKEKNPEGRVDSIILSGGSSKLQGLDRYFTQRLGVQTNIGNPWRKVNCDERLKPFIEKMGISFSIALGLAFLGIEENIKNDK